MVIYERLSQENHLHRYRHLIPMGELQITALEVNEEGKQMIDTIRISILGSTDLKFIIHNGKWENQRQQKQ